MANVPTQHMMTTLVTDLTTHVSSGNYSGALVGNYLMLFTNNPSLTSQTVLGDLTEATYTGYARQAVTYGAAFQQSDGSIAVQGSLLQFQPSDDAVPNTVYGAAVVSAVSSGSLLWAELFDTPVGLPDAETALLYSPQFSYSGTDAGSGTLVV